MDNEQKDKKITTVSAEPPEAPAQTVSGISLVMDQPQQQQEQDQNDNQSNIKSILATVAVLVIAPLMAFILTAFVFQSYEVDGPSMETTLQNRDRLIVLKLPKTIAKITRKQYVPKRADIIIFNLDEGSLGKRQLIKRVIALPGERITIKNSRVTVYNDENPKGFNPDGAPYGSVITYTSGDIDLVVPEGSIFVCGDNRPNSSDSRAFGPVPLKDVVGKLALRVYPLNKGQSF
jgi:signal peptidase I